MTRRQPFATGGHRLPKPVMSHEDKATLLLAVASKHGLSIDEHFGHASRFWIYQIGADTVELLEKREVEHYCLGGTSSKTAMSGIMESIKDCRAVFVAKIGDGPIAKLGEIGIEAVDRYAYEAIGESLADYVKRNDA